MRISRLHFGRGHNHRLLQLFQSRARQGTHGDDRFWVIQECPAHKLFHFQSHDLESLRIHRIGFGEYRDSALPPKKLQDVKVLPRLRFDRFIRRNHQQHQINPAYPGQHIANETLVPGNIDKAQPQRLSARRKQIHVGEAKVNGDAPPLLFLKPVSVDPGQRLHQRRLAVVDVSRRSYDDEFHLAGILPEKDFMIENHVHGDSTYPAALLNATIELPHDSCLPSGDPAAARPHA